YQHSDRFFLFLSSRRRHTISKRDWSSDVCSSDLMRQKAQMICALLPDVPILLIDETFMGLDVHAMHFFEKIIEEKSVKGTSILLTTHQLDRVKTIANSFIVLQEGRLKASGPIADFKTIP